MARRSRPAGIEFGTLVAPSTAPPVRAAQRRAASAAPAVSTAAKTVFRLALAAAAASTILGVSTAAWASCAAPANSVEAENCLAGTPQSVWDVTGAGDLTIQGFATSISVARGQQIGFKVKTTASAYRIEIYRLGYYQGNGARLVATLSPTATLPQAQPSCLTDAATGLIDCGNWSLSASWAVPASAVSGIYLARAVRSDTGGASHMVFVVRDDSSTSDLFFQASDTTWQAYNDYGGNNLYVGGAVGRAYKVSYNRPFNTRVFQDSSWVFNAEYPMVRWLEANGFDVSYTTDTDSDRNGALIKSHKVWISNGHDEYWSAGQRANVEAARAAGVHLAFFSANKIFWKTRWENSIDGTATPFRTLVCYKETHAGAVIDPADPPTWTGTWRDPRFSPPADGGKPENALAGSLFRINGPFTGNITVAAADGRMRFWRNTAAATLAAGQTLALATGTLGAEVDVDEDNGFRPPGLLDLSTTPISTTNAYLLDYGSSFGSGTTVHNLTLYRHSSGALVFSTGVYNWAWGLDLNHDSATGDLAPDTNMQQATVNLLADMGAQPATLQPGLLKAVPSQDLSPPSSTISSPAAGSGVVVGASIAISGTASDFGGGVVGAVEVSTDQGTSWHRATGRETWTYSWRPSSVGPVVLRSRAVDDSGNIEIPAAGVSVNVDPCSANCTIWPSTAAPNQIDHGADAAVELGVTFRPDVNGTITGIRFYKASTNTGTHVGNLWTSAGALLATATFTGETSSGWQQVNFATPVAITANTLYVASYHTDVGHYSEDVNAFAAAGVDAPPLHAVANSTSFNGLYSYSATSVFPTSTYNSSNYWVDVVFNATALTAITLSPSTASIPTGTTQQFTATGSLSGGGSEDLTTAATWTSSDTTIATINSAGVASAQRPGTTTIRATRSSVSGTATLTVPATALAIATTTLPPGSQNSPYSTTLAASGGLPPYSWRLVSGGLPPGLALSAGGVIQGTPSASGTSSFTVGATDQGGQSASQTLALVIAVPSVSLFAPSAAPARVDSGPDSSVEIGVKFSSDRNGTIKGIRFYKSSLNTGVHVGNLWSSTGALLASATFASETASGWQQVNFATPVSITGNTTYVASYHANGGHYSEDLNYFANTGVDAPPLHAAWNGNSPNGVYVYSSSSLFPSNSYQAANYWVDIIFTPATISSVTVTPAVATTLPGSGQQFAAVATYSDGTSQDVTTQASWSSSNTTVATVNPLGNASALRAGSTAITASIGGASASATLNVSSSPLTVATNSLPGATRNAFYSTALAATGGSAPYSWTVSSGTLPPGITASSGGTISGTPTTAGSYGFSVQVLDSSGQSATKALTLAVSNPPVTIWSASAAPIRSDAGPDASVELGVKFRSDVAGNVVGVRFYKSFANTGTHVGTLWSSNGTALASATFTGESASGWQQVSFASPVSIAANTVYIISYHTDTGHYSQDLNSFATAGVDAPPLHALANTISANGVYAYGTGPVFPSASFNASNYWVDVVFTPGP